MSEMLTLDRLEDLDFAALIRPGDTVVCAQALGEPVSLTRQLMAQRGAIGRFNVFLGLTLADTFLPEHADAVQFRSYGGFGSNGALATAGVLDIVPAHYSDLARFHADGTLAADVVLLTLGAPGADGRFNLGLNHDYVIDAARRARVVVAEVARGVPWVFGAELPDDIQPHVLVRTGRDLATAEAGRERTSEVDEAISKRVAERVPDGAILEVGIGALPSGVLRALRGHRDLGVHSGMISDGVMELMEAGVVTNATKPVDRGVTVGGMLIGSRRLLDFAHRNPRLRLASSHATHDTAALRQLPAFFALNAALQVDLTGQVNAECLDGRYVGAVGGQIDYVRGANGVRGGAALMMLPATAKGGTRSRIVARLHDGVVTTPRSDVDAVVTEFGIAHLKGRTLSERAQALIKVAHPDFREELARAARELGWISWRQV